MNSLKPVPVALALSCLAAFAGHAAGQAIGPDCISSSHSDVARNGTNAAGTIIGYSIGSITCNHGDMPMAASPNNSIRPLMSQEMYRLKTYTAGSASYQRMEQIGQGWVKWIAVPVNGTSGTCGTCVGGGSGFMGVNCSDVYGSGFNGPAGMAKRSIINATTGYLSGTRGGGTAEANINTRVQVAAADVAGQPAGTRFFVESVHLLPHDASYVRPGQTVAVNAMNNAASQEININSGAGNPVLLGGASNQQIPVIQRWKDIDPSVTLITADHDDTPNPDPNFPNTFIRSRYYVAAKVTDLGAGQWRYEYAVYNLNSDRSAGSFTIPLPGGATFSEFAFRHAPAHSGEAISNAAWTTSRVGSALTFTTEKHVDNSNANAIRWGSLYNFGFTTNAAPTTGLGTIGLFKPGALSSIIAPAIPVPTVCVADVNADNALTADDVIAFLNAFFGTNLAVADIATLGGGPLPDGRLTADDLVFFLSSFFAGCPQ